MPTRATFTRLAHAAALAAALAAASGCGAINTLATKSIANTLAKPSDVYTRDDDPELVRKAIPFGLMTFESLLDTVPRHKPLLIATCSGFASYAFGFVQTDADILGEAGHHDEVKALNAEAVKLYLRGKDYCLRALDVRFHGIGKQLLIDPVAALAKADKKDVELLYWTAASWGGAMALDLDLAIDFPVVRALVERGLALDETWSRGALHELMITLDAVEQLGGDVKKAREHFARAVELQKGESPGPYVALAMGVSQPKQDRAEFEKLINTALAIDPEKDPSHRLITILAQRRARALLDQIDTLFAKRPFELRSAAPTEGRPAVHPE
jgi:predicted anti-sigma-YlaC factor YlaD